MITVRQRETYTAQRWFPGEEVAGVRLCAIAGQEKKEYLLQKWPGGAESVGINPGDWVLVSESGYRFALDDATFQRAYIEVRP